MTLNPEEIDAKLKTYQNRLWIAGGLVLTIVSTLGTLAHHQTKLAEVCQAQAQGATQAFLEKTAVAEDAEARAKAANARADAAEAENARRKQALDAAPMPEPAPPVPTDPSALQRSLHDWGIGTTLPTMEASLVWTWHGEAQRVPALEKRCAAAEDLAAGEAQEVETLKVANLETTRAGEAWHASSDAAQVSVKDLNASVNHLQQAQTATVWTYRIGGAAVTVTAFWLGWKLGRK